MTSSVPLLMKRLLQSSANLIPYRYRGYIRRIPGLNQFQRHLVVKCLEGASFKHRIKGGPANGLVYPVLLPQDKQIWLGNYEQYFSELLASAVNPGDICFDIGGYRGFFSGVMAQQRAGQVHVFEPLPSNVEQIRQMAALNPHLPIFIHQMALADVEGETEFAVMPEASMGKLHQSNFDKSNLPERKISVKLRTIDAMLEQGIVAAPKLIKIDVEGAEVLVLKGARGLIAKHRPTFFIEAHSHSLARQCVDILKPHDYSFRVLETGSYPDYKLEPDVCHIHAAPTQVADICVNSCV